MSVQVSYKKQTMLGIIGITILLLVIEVIANVWWVTQINCEFEQNEIFQSISEEIFVWIFMKLKHQTMKLFLIKVLTQ